MKELDKAQNKYSKYDKKTDSALLAIQNIPTKYLKQ